MRNELEFGDGLVIFSLSFDPNCANAVGSLSQSYGGYLTAKVIETNSGVFSLGLSVAPVTNWEFYDTICKSSFYFFFFLLCKSFS